MNRNIEELTKRIREEYVIVFGERFGSGTTYYAYNQSDKEMPKAHPYFIDYHSATKYTSREQAEKVLKDLVSKEFFKDTFSRTCNRIVEDSETFEHSLIHAWYDNDFPKTRGMSVVRIPNSHYLGKYGAFAYEIAKMNLPYDNEHRYQCRNNNGKYLKVFTHNIFDWVEDIADASFLTSEEQEEWCRKLKFTYPKNLPLKLDTPQKFYKGQRVLVGGCNGIYYYSHINDVIALNGKWHYALPQDSVYGNNIGIIKEGYEGADLYEEERIKLFDDVVKSCKREETRFDIYFTNVVLKDGKKLANPIHHL